MAGEHRRAPLGGGGEGDGLGGVPQGLAVEFLGHGPGGVVVRLHGLVKGVKGLGDHSLGVLLLVQVHHLPYLHVGLGDGARLVYAQNVHPGQGLDAVHILGQHLALGQANHAHRQGHAGQQVEPLGDHADEGGHHGHHRLLGGALQEDELLDEQGHADGDEQDADDADELVQGGHHLALAHGDILLGLQGEAGGVGLRPHPVQPGPAAAGHHEGAGEQLVAGGLGDGVGLAGDEGLVDLHLAGEDGGVGGDLVAGGQLRHVIPHQLGGGHGDQVPLPHYVGPGGGQQVELVHGLLGAELLNDANAGIGHGDEQKEHVVEGAHRHQQGRQHHKDEVEEGKDVFAHDLPHRLGGGVHRVVCPAVLLPLFYLVQGEPLLRIGAEPGHLPPGLGGRDLRGRLLCVLAFHASASDFLKIRSDTSVV